MSIGALVAYIFMALNFYLAYPAESKCPIDVIQKGFAYDIFIEKRPYAVVLLNGMQKKIRFSDENEFNSFDNVNLNTKRGRLGYAIIIKKSPESDQH